MSLSRGGSSLTVPAARNDGQTPRRFVEQSSVGLVRRRQCGRCWNRTQAVTKLARITCLRQHEWGGVATTRSSPRAQPAGPGDRRGTRPPLHAARCRSLVQSGEVRVVAQKEVSATTNQTSSPAAVRQWRRSPTSARRSSCSSKSTLTSRSCTASAAPGRAALRARSATIVSPLLETTSAGDSSGRLGDAWLSSTTEVGVRCRPHGPLRVARLCCEVGSPALESVPRVSRRCERAPADALSRVSRPLPELARVRGVDATAVG